MNGEYVPATESNELDTQGPAQASTDSEIRVKAVKSAAAITSLEQTRIEITDVQTSESGPSSDIPEKQIRVQVRFNIAGPAADALVGDKLSFRVEVHLVDLESGASSLVTSRRAELQPQLFEYASWQQFAIPAVGRYRVYCITLLLPPGHLAAYHAGSFINIAP